MSIEVQSEVGIASAASLYLGRDEIATFDDLEDTNAQIFKRRYPAIRDKLLRTYPWNFAMRFSALPGATLETPMFGFTKKFTLPSGGELPYCLRLWSVDTACVYSVRGREIYTTAAAPLPINYVSREENTEIFDPLFCELLAVDLALALINRVPTDEVRKRTRELMGVRKDLRRDARMTDAMEQSGGKFAAGSGQGSWLDARRPA